LLDESERPSAQLCCHCSVVKKPKTRTFVQYASAVETGVTLTTPFSARHAVSYERALRYNVGLFPNRFSPMPNSILFPENFLWGSATSAFQIEGATNADGRGESNWDRFCQQHGSIADNTDGTIACDHYHRYKEDVQLIASLGLQAYRFSIAWPRVIPSGRGAVNQKGLDFYDRLVDELLQANIAPYATLYHWDLPQVLEDDNGWVNRDTAYAFVDYTRTVVERLGDRVASWATLNEPYVSVNHGYRTGEHAPGRQSITDAFAAAHHLLLAHGLAMPVIREHAPKSDAGIVLNFTPCFANSDDPANQQASDIADGWDNRWYVEPIAGKGYPRETVESLGWNQKEVQPGDMDIIAAPIDFMGVNYYTRQSVRADGSPGSKSLPLTDMGWEIYPQGIHETLSRLHDSHKFKKYYITENGAAMPDQADENDFVDDQDRIDYLHGHLQQIHLAIESGIPVKGYFAWSLFDNFEWAFGYAKRFGIVRVNYETLERTPKASAHWFGQIAVANAMSGQ